VVRADLLLHVVDASHPQAAEQIEAVNAVLEEIGASGKPTLTVLNKIDRVTGSVEKLLERHTNAVAVSAKTGAGLPELIAELSNQMRPIREFMELLVPHESAAVIARLHAVGQVMERNYDGDKAWFRARIPPHLHEEFAPFMVTELPGVSA
jgi:GTP-binding protein HflX